MADRGVFRHRPSSRAAWPRTCLSSRHVVRVPARRLRSSPAVPCRETCTHARSVHVCAIPHNSYIGRQRCVRVSNETTLCAHRQGRIVPGWEATPRVEVMAWWGRAAGEGAADAGPAGPSGPERAQAHEPSAKVSAQEPLTAKQRALDACAAQHSRLIKCLATEASWKAFNGAWSLPHSQPAAGGVSGSRRAPHAVMLPSSSSRWAPSTHERAHTHVCVQYIYTYIHTCVYTTRQLFGGRCDV